MNNKAIKEFGFRRMLSTSAFGSVDYTLLDLLNSSYPTQPHSLIAKYIESKNNSNIFIWLRYLRIKLS